MNLPTHEGWYVWYILDLDYTKIGLMRIAKDTEEHLTYLRKYGTNYIYGESPNELTVYHAALDALPPLADDQRPIVDGWFPWNWDWINNAEKQMKEKIHAHQKTATTKRR